MLILSIKKKTIIIVLILILLLSTFLALPSLASSTTTTKFTIVIDAGHGGIDGGSVSPFSGIDENHLNLDYAKSLKNILEEIGFRVVMTRENLNGLYSLFSNDRKKDDMKKREEIINSSKADMVISIHMNSFPLKSCRGAQVFYKNDDLSSKFLADNIQNLFVQNLPNSRTAPQSGDYFILNCSNIPSVIVECGFISNPEEEALLITEEYRNKVCLCIAYGIVLSLSY